MQHVCLGRADHDASRPAGPDYGFQYRRAGQLNTGLPGPISVGKLAGGGHLARAELMRLFAEGVWYPTARLPCQGVIWTAVDVTSARATMTDAPLTLTLLSRFGADGLVASIHAGARAATVDGATVMLPWECRMSDYLPPGRMVVPMIGEVLCLTGQGERPFFRGTVTRIGQTYWGLSRHQPVAHHDLPPT